MTSRSLPCWQPKSSRRKQAPSLDQDNGFKRTNWAVNGSARKCVSGWIVSWFPRKFWNSDVYTSERKKGIINVIQYTTGQNEFVMTQEIIQTAT